MPNINNPEIPKPIINSRNEWCSVPLCLRILIAPKNTNTDARAGINAHEKADSGDALAYHNGRPTVKGAISPVIIAKKLSRIVLPELTI